MTPIRTAIIGYGQSGACFHAPVLRALSAFAIVAVVSSRPDDVHADFPGVAVYPDVATLLARSDAELCIVATLNHLHRPHAEACLRAGRHAVVEKPFVLNSREGWALDRLARDRGLRLAVYQIKRWDRDFRTLSRVVADGGIGRPHALISHFDRWRPTVRNRWREMEGPGAGILWDLGPHLVDQALLIFGMPATISARVARVRPGATAVDHFHLVLDYGDRVAILHADCLTLGAGRRLEAHGDRGSFVKCGMDHQEMLLRVKRGPLDPEWGLEPADRRARVTTVGPDGAAHEVEVPAEPGGYERFYLDLAAAIRQGKPPPVDAVSATRVIAVLEAAIISAREGRSVAPLGDAEAIAPAG